MEISKKSISKFKFSWPALLALGFWTGLVVWGGEFGRTPSSGNGNGRGHNAKGYTTWMAGGGVKGGHSHGATDEHGYEAVDGRMHIHDWHATIMHLLGLDHEQLTYQYAGHDFRLTDVHGRVAREILA